MRYGPLSPRPGDRLSEALADLSRLQLGMEAEMMRRRDSESLFDTVFDALADAVLLIDPRGFVTRGNEGALRLTGHSAEALVGRRPSDLFGEAAPASPWEILGRGPAGRVEELETDLRHADGHTIPVVVSCALVHDAHHKVVGALYTARDITERRRSERRREAQLAVTRALAESRTAAEALPRLLEAVGRAHDWGAGAATLADGQGRLLPYTDVWAADGAGADGSPWRAGVPPELARCDDATVAVFEIPPGEDGAAAPWAAGMRLPLSTGERVIGLLEFRSRRRRAPEPRTAEHLSAIGVQIGQFIERKRAEEALGKIELFKTAFDGAPVGMALFGAARDERLRLLEVNGTLCRLVGRTPESLVGAAVDVLVRADDRGRLRAEIDAVLRGARPTSAVEARCQQAGDAVVWGSFHCSLLRDATGRPLYGVLQVQDVTERRAAEQELAHQALHDPLTGLPNRTLFIDRVEHALRRARRDPSQAVAVMFIDLDHFKFVNDSLGHNAGDQVLITVASRISDLVRGGDTVTRFGGDEFAVLCEQLDEPGAADEIADRIAKALAVPVTAGNREVVVSASVGIAPATGTDDAEALLRDADTAMYVAKRRGRARHATFDTTMRTLALRRREIEDALRKALPRDELRLAYQPVVTLDGRTVSFEALLRWEHPVHGLVEPTEFIPLAEETGLIVPMGAWVLEHACREALRWRDVDGRAIGVAVNLSPRQLIEPGLAEAVQRVLQTSGLAPSRLCLEITETVLSAESSMLRELPALKALGVRIAIDDFGVGSSSLSRLSRVPPVDIIKLDRSYVGGVLTRPADRAIVAAGVSVARALGAVSVAEGVETIEQLERLRTLECDLAQGFLFATPLTPAAALQHLADERTTGRARPLHGGASSGAGAPQSR